MSTTISLQQSEFEQIYALFDADASGYLTRQEIVDALGVLGQKVSDQDRAKLLGLVTEAGTVSRDRFISWMSQRADLDVSADLREIFRLIDQDGSGYLSFEEFIPIVRCLNVTASDAEVVALVKRADSDGDGQISFEEFISTQAQGSQLQITIAALRSFKKILTQYSRVAEIPSIALVEVDSDLGAGRRGASKGIDFLKEAAIQKQSARMRSDNGILSSGTISFDSRAIQNENQALNKLECQSKFTPHARYISAIYTVLDRTSSVVSSTLKEGLFPVVLGGDHSTAAGTIAGIKQAFPTQRLGVVWIDAHADIHSPYTTPSGNMHGMPLAIATNHNNHPQQINQLDAETAKLWDLCKALGAKNNSNLAFEDIVYVSVRDTEAAEDYIIEQHKILNLTTQTVREIGPEATAKRCLDYLKDVDIIYVTFDVDSMDSTICMGTGTPVAGGLWADEARRLNAALVGDPRVCCWEICEINPLLDTLNTLAENSLEIFEAVIDTLTESAKARILTLLAQANAAAGSKV